MKLIILGCAILAATYGAKIDQTLRPQSREFIQKTQGPGILHVQHGVQFTPVSLTSQNNPAAVLTAGEFSQSDSLVSGFPSQFSSVQRDRQQNLAALHFSQPQHDFLRQFNPQHQIFTQSQGALNQDQLSRLQQQIQQQGLIQDAMSGRLQEGIRPQFSQQFSQNHPQFRSRDSQRQKFSPDFSQHQDQQAFMSQFFMQDPRTGQLSLRPQTIFPQFQLQQRDGFSQRQEEQRQHGQTVSSQQQQGSAQFSDRERNMQERRPQFSQQQKQQQDSQFTPQQQQQEKRPQFSQQQQQDRRTESSLQFGQNQGSRRGQQGTQGAQRTSLLTHRQDTSRPATLQTRQQGTASTRSSEKGRTNQASTQLASTVTMMQDIRKSSETPANIQTKKMQVISGHIESNVGSTVLGIFRPFFVPRSATLAEGKISSTFTCSQFGQGHYSDRESQCRMFHVCSPVKATSHSDTTHHYRFTFRCGNGERFDEKSVSCVRSNACPAASLIRSSSSPSTTSARFFMDFPGNTPKQADICYLATDYKITGVRRK